MSEAGPIPPQKQNPKVSKAAKPSRRLLLAIGLLTVLGLIYWTEGFGLLPRKGNLRSAAGVLVFEDSDRDFKNPTVGDVVTLFSPDGTSSRKVGNLNTAETVGGHRALSVSPDGRFFLLSENVSNQITAFDLKSGNRLWTAPGIGATVVAPGGPIYGLRNNGSIRGSGVVAISPDTGKVITSAYALVSGFDLTLDNERKALWLAGSKIIKCDLQYNVLFETNVIGWCAVSVDVAPDGSAWIAERDHQDVTPSSNRIFNISSTGQVMKSVVLPFSPLCLRVDRSNGCVWVTGISAHSPVTKSALESIEKRTGRLPTGAWLRNLLTRTRVDYLTWRFDRNGNVLQKINQGGFTLDIDQTDGSLWIGGYEVYHYSREGKRLGHSGNGATTQKYVVVIPKSREQTK